ncbi:MAG: CoA pyrophosphatase, partial [Candidatus Rokubacteria bacterium]|nr:CoA pyrophosphatase [Candidatus Rokubacteria bacterium]
EAEEEIGLPASAVEILGTLDDTETRATRFVITPFVGVIRKPVRYRPDGKEIEQVLEMPLDALLDPANFRVEIWERADHTSPVYFYEYRGVTIWGATARILKQFLDLVFPERAQG